MMFSPLLVVTAFVLFCRHFSVIGAQFTCLSACGSSSVLGVYSSIGECCIENDGGGYVRGGGSCSPCSPFRAVDPRISFLFNPEVPVVGRPFTGLCTATISSGLSGAIRLEWRDEEGMVIASSNGTSSAEVAFVIDNFMMANSTVLGGYTCSADITAENGTRRYSISLERGILFTSTPSSTSITSAGDFTVGSQFQLTCTVMGVIMAPVIMWFGPQGMLGSSTARVQVGDIIAMGDTYSRSLFFPSLSAEQAGTYTCMNTVTDPPTVAQTLFLADRNITTTSSPTLGQPFTASCEVSVPASLSATVLTELLDPAGRQLASGLGVSSAEAVFLLPNLNSSDLGQYSCRSSVFSNQLNSPVITEQAFTVQIDNCSRCVDVPNSECVETPSGTSCQCISGYMLGPESQCINIDECYEGIDGCDINADCYDLPGSYTCFCRVGYTGNGTTCTDIDECSLNISSCDLATMNCLNTAGSFSCMDKVVEPGRNECETGEADCDENAVCVDTPETFSCFCREGYTGNGSKCWDIDECYGLDECDVNAKCINLPGAYLCRCNSGYFGTGYTCKPFFEDNENCTVEVTTPRLTHTRTHTHRTRHSHTHSRSTRYSTTRSRTHTHTHRTIHTHTHTHSPTYTTTRCPPSDEEEDTTPRTTRTQTKTTPMTTPRTTRTRTKTTPRTTPRTTRTRTKTTPRTTPRTTYTRTKTTPRTRTMTTSRSGTRAVMIPYSGDLHIINSGSRSTKKKKSRHSHSHSHSHSHRSEDEYYEEDTTTTTTGTKKKGKKGHH